MKSLEQRIEQLEQKIASQEDLNVRFRVIIHDREKPEDEEYEICTMHENCYTHSFIINFNKSKNES